MVDAVTGTLTVSIDDDMPILVQAPANQILNGDFSEGTFASFWFGGIAQPNDVTGWVVSNSTFEPPAPGSLQVERVIDGYLGLHSSTHGSMIDMGASPGNIQISQQLSGLTLGQTYAIEFEAGAPYPSTAKLEVVWNNVVIGTIDPAGPMTSYAYVVTATGIAANDQITFREVGQGHLPLPGQADEGYHGTYLANVAVIATAVVDEDGLKAPALSVGNNDSQTGDNVVPNSDGDTNEATATGNLNIKWGADNLDSAVADTPTGLFGTLVQDAPGGVGNRSVTFTDNSVTVAGSVPLTSNGYAVTFVLSAGNTVLSGVTADGRTVLQVSLSDDGTGQFRFVLLDQLDHAANGNENDIALTFNYTATDSDGDAVSSQFVVSVDDDVPVQVGDAAITRTVDEDELSDGNTDGDAFTTVATGSLASLVSVGADEDGTFTIGSTGGLPDLTSKGAAVVYNVTGDTLTGFVDTGPSGLDANDRLVFTLQVETNGDFTFTLLDQVDHLPNDVPAGDNQSLALNFASAIKFTDADGDSITLSGGFTINVEDDIPTTALNTLVTVDEDDLVPAGNNDTTSPGDDTTSVSPVTGTLQFSVGADESATVGFASLDGAAVLDTGGKAVTPAGVALHYFWDASSNTLYASTDARCGDCRSDRLLSRSPSQIRLPAPTASRCSARSIIPATTIRRAGRRPRYGLRRQHQHRPDLHRHRSRW